MFTGIIEELGQVKGIHRRGRVTLLEVSAPTVATDAAIGDSVAVNGACLTVVKNERGALSFEVMQESLRCTDLAALKLSEKVNLERSLKVGDRLSGHFVLGHVDCVGVVRRKSIAHNNAAFEIAYPPQHRSLIVPKGSIAVDGISLTVQEIKPASFTVYIIPHTMEHTTLRVKGPSDRVNLEFDMLLKKR